MSHPPRCVVERMRATPGSPFGLRLLQRVYLFVCGENTSRSPVAQAICNSEVARLLKLQPGEGKPKFEALSAGLSVSASRPISTRISPRKV